MSRIYLYIIYLVRFRQKKTQVEGSPWLPRTVGVKYDLLVGSASTGVLQSVATMTNYVIWITLLTILESFFKNSLMGVIKALEQQKRALDVNFISYMCLVIPVAYFFAFKSQKYGLFVDEPGADTNNRGTGLWVGYVIGIGWQDLGYLYIIASTDWQKIADGAQERQQKTLDEKEK